MKLKAFKKIIAVILSTVVLMSSSSVLLQASAYDGTYTLTSGNVSITSSGSYYVNGNSTQTTNRISIGANLTVDLSIENIKIVDGYWGIEIGDNSKVTLNIIGDNLIKLKVTGSASNPAVNMGEGVELTIDAADTNQVLSAYGGTLGCGIGSKYMYNTKSITINNGTINAYGNDWSSAIGSASDGSIESITINGGKIYADGTYTSYTGSSIRGSAGIGAGHKGTVGSITINGGVIEAHGGRQASAIGATWDNPSDDSTIIGGIYVNGGDIKAYGGAMSSGIGGAYQAKCDEIIITDGTIIAQGGVNGIVDDNGGAGIGCGDSYGLDTLRITGGNITAVGAVDAAGIGCAYGSTIYNEFTISGDAVVNATGGKNGAGIGGGRASHVNSGISITDTANVTAQGGNYGSGIGLGYKTCDINGDINISGSANVKAFGGEGYGTGIGGTSYGGHVHGINITGNAIVEARAGATSGYGIGSMYSESDNALAVNIGGSADVRAYGSNSYPAIGSDDGGTVNRLSVKDSALVRAYSGTDDAILFGGIESNTANRTLLQGTFLNSVTEDTTVSVSKNLAGTLILPSGFKSFATVVTAGSTSTIKVGSTVYQGLKTKPTAATVNTINFTAQLKALSKYINLEPAYKVTLTAEGPGTITGTKTYYTAKGQTLSGECSPALSYTAVPNANCSLTGWKNITGSPESQTITADTTFSAVFATNTYSVTFNSDGGSPTPASQTVAHGSKATKPTDPSKTGHTFTGWYNGSTKWDFNSSVTSALSLKAGWSVNNYAYTIKYKDASGNTIKTDKTGTAAYGSTLTETAPTITGYTPRKTSDCITINTSGNTLTFTYDANLYSYTVIYEDASGNEIATRKTGSAPYKSVINETAIDITGYTPTDTAKSLTIGTGSNVIHFSYSLNQYTITFNPNNGNANTTSNVNHGSKVTEPTSPAKTGYTFTGWYNGDTKWNFNNAVTGDMTLDAKYSVNSYAYTVKYLDSSGNALKTAKSGTATYGSTLTETAPTITGYTPSQNSKSITIGTSNNVITFTYTANSYGYTVKYVDSNGTVLKTQKTGTAAYGTTVTETAPAITGYTPSQNTKSITIGTSNNVITFTYSVNSYDYTVKYLDTNGTVLKTQKTGSAAYGSTLTETAPAITGYTPDASSKSITVTTSGNLITFTYTIITYTVTFNPNNGSAQTNISVNYGANVAKPANPVKEGHTFKAWQTVDGQNYNFSSPVYGDMTLTAYFTINSYSYTVNYKDEQGNTIAESTTAQATFGSSVTVYPKDIDGYLCSDTGKTIIIKTSGNTVTFEYIKNRSDFKVIIPKRLILNGRRGSDYSGSYTVKVEGDLISADKLYVMPSSTFSMNSRHKNAITATVTQVKTSFLRSDGVADGASVSTTGRVKANNLSAGSWSGSFNFNIYLVKQ